MEPITYASVASAGCATSRVSCHSRTGRDRAGVSTGPTGGSPGPTEATSTPLPSTHLPTSAMPVPTDPTGGHGLPGARGVTGARGETGPMGTHGHKGNQGEHGRPGARGVTGAGGETGPMGANGHQGSTGPAASMATMAWTVSTEWTVHQGIKVLEEMSVPPAPRAAQACRGLMVLMAYPE